MLVIAKSRFEISRALLISKQFQRSTDFKARFSNHKHSFTHRNKRNATELSKEVWRAKDNGVEPAIKWSIVSTAPSYKCGGSRCNLCLAEKLAILSGDRKIMLNKRSEIVNTCRHRKRKKKEKNLN